MSNSSTPADSTDPSRSSTPARFTQTTETLEEALKTQTVGLVHLSEFKKRRAELAEARDREAAEKLQPSQASSAVASREGSIDRGIVKKKRKVGVAKGKLSFGGDDENGEEGESERDADEADGEEKGRKRKFNPKLKAPPPKAMTKSTLRREAQEREMLRREFLELQDKIKNEEITIPFVFYDGTNVPPPNGEGVTIKKGEAVWLFLERARRMSGRREWVRVSVDDLLLVRGEVIIPHHYLFYYFITNKTTGPNGILFDYPSPLDPAENANGETVEERKTEDEDPTMTKVVDRRWYERNKHIFPASVWTEFDPNVDYNGIVRRDLGGNAFFFG